MDSDVAERFVQAIVDHDRAGMLALLAPDVDFRGMTPGRTWEASSPEEVVGVFLDHWFEDSDHVDAVTRLARGDDVVDLRHLSYRCEVTNDRGSHTVEQQAYYRTSDGRLSYLRVMCSGFRPRTAGAAG